MILKSIANGKLNLIKYCYLKFLIFCISFKLEFINLFKYIIKLNYDYIPIEQL